MVCSVTSACCLPVSTRLTASSVSITELLIPFWMSPRMRPDLDGRFLGLVGQVLHLVGHDREAAALVAGGGRLDGRVQGQQVGALGDVVDRGDDLADGLGLFAQGHDVPGHLLDLFADGLHGPGGVLHGLKARHCWRRRLASAAAATCLAFSEIWEPGLADLLHGGGDLLDRGGLFLGAGRLLLGRGHDLRGRRRSGCPSRTGRLAGQLAQAAQHPLKVFAQFADLVAGGHRQLSRRQVALGDLLRHTP